MITEHEIQQKFQEGVNAMMRKGTRVPYEWTGPMFTLTDEYRRFREQVLAQDVYAPHDIITGKTKL